MSLLTEKYRPRVRGEIVGNKAVIDEIFGVVKTGNIPHMIFDGTAGTGKTTTALVIARELFGEYFRSNFLELNASDERGINVVRETIKTFCKTSPLGDINFKILLLDEADNMTTDAQEALRRIMEQYSQVTRFILCCNDVERIIEPIRSRCQEFRFSPLANNDIKDRLVYISNKEGVTYYSNTLEKIAEQANGDMRKALNKLQVLMSYGVMDDASEIVLKKINQKDIGVKILENLIRGRFLQSRKEVRDYLVMGYTERDLCNLLHLAFINDKSLSAEKKGESIICLADTDEKLTRGVSKGLQIDATLLKLIKILKE